MKLPDNITFLGTDDDELDLFEGQYPLSAGISYNSYLINCDKIAIIDAVDRRKSEVWLNMLQGELKGRKPDYLIIQHMEPDHSGSLRELLILYPDVKIVCSVPAKAMLIDYFEDLDFTNKVLTVKDGEALSLGRTSLRFLTAPMVHWPEVMLTVDETDGVLFSADAFGSFAMSGAEIESAWPTEARRYYTNIVGRFGTSVQALMKKLQGLKFSVIAPLHGPVLTDDLPRYWGLYDKWSRYEPESDGVFVAYASVYGGTAHAAEMIAAELRRRGASDVVLMDLCRHDVSYAVAEAFRLSCMVACSVTYDAGLFPAMLNFLHHLQAKKLKNRKVALVENGSWAPIAAKQMAAEFEKMEGMTVVPEILTIKSRLHKSDFPAIESLVDSLLSD
ncbi:MAG: FprA family A-type flavoprotein [Muribaculaceae bacterium]|nr:FprA family A-type flavoprotein [Muribaculaceae bacterium]